MKKKAVLFLKPIVTNVTAETIGAEVIPCDLSAGPLEQLSLLANELYMPILSNAACHENWSETVQKEITDKLNSFMANLYVMIGNTKGETLLPFPPHDDDSGEINKDRVHGLETAIVRWSKQINSVLKTSPEAMIASDPEPLVELEFWISKAKNLGSIQTQIESDQMKNILSYLASCENAFGVQFQKLAGEVEIAFNEATDNAKYLQTMRSVFSKYLIYLISIF